LPRAPFFDTPWPPFIAMSIAFLLILMHVRVRVLPILLLRNAPKSLMFEHIISNIPRLAM